MAVKKSRTGKKKRPQYGPNGTKELEAKLPSEEEVQKYKSARRANFASIGLLFVAMILLFVSPNATGGDVRSAVTAIIAYALTIISGFLIYTTTKYVVPERVKMTKVTAGVLIVIGAAGLFMTASTLTTM